MKALIALITAWTGAPAHSAEPPPATPAYAGAPVLGDVSAMAGEAGSGTAVEAAARTITNLASLDRSDAAAARPRLGISLAAAGPAAPPGAKPTGPTKPAAIYGHSVDDVVIGNTSRKTSGRPATPARRAAIYNGTITSEPTQLLHAADGASGQRRGAPKATQATKPPKR
jgi:hypothetical protein